MADIAPKKKVNKYKSSYQKRNVGNDYALKKRPPRKYHDNAIYVTNKTDIKALLKRCETYFTKNINEIFIYCIGAAIERGINLALQFVDKYPSYQLSVNTSTITLTDDLEPLTDDLDYEVQKRENSKIHIRIFRENVVEILSSSLQ